MIGRVTSFGLGVFLAFPIYDGFTMQKSDTHTFFSAADQYIQYRVMSLIGHMRRKAFDKECETYRDHQAKFLQEAIKPNAYTVYGKEYGFPQVVNTKNPHAVVERFRQRHPVTEYDHYKKWFKVMKDQGTTGHLLAKRLKMWAETSGTSGSRKLLPITEDQQKIFFLHGIAVIFDQMFKAFPQCWSLQRSTKLTYVPSYSVNESDGLRIGPNSSTPDDSKAQANLYSTPMQAYITEDERDMIFIHALFALRDRSLGHLESNFVPGIYGFMETIRTRWPELLACLAQCSVTPSMNEGAQKDLLPSVSTQGKHELNQLLHRIPGGGSASLERAKELSLVCHELFSKDEQRQSEQNKPNVFRALWPKMNMLLSVNTGAFEFYWERLCQDYGKMPIYSPLYAASEGLVAVNIMDGKPNKGPFGDADPKKVTYVLAPSAMYYELIPVGTPDERVGEAIIPSHKGEVGKDYELVITTKCGLFRYRFGDVVRITGCYKRAPIVQFCYRRGQLINLRGEKTSEAVLSDSLMQVQWCNGRILKGFTVAEEPSLTAFGVTRAAPAYHIFVELEEASSLEGTGARATPTTNSGSWFGWLWGSGKASTAARAPDDGLSSAEIESIDHELRSRNELYGLFRSKGMLDRVNVFVVKPNMFSDFRRELILAGGAPQQVKLPRVLRQPEHIKFMLDRVVQ
eukprot:Clim_evm99s134 gene=Clim_evmTU99s134